MGITSRGAIALRTMTALVAVCLVGVIPRAVAAAETTPQPTARPAGAAKPGAKEWYSVDLPDGKVATLGVYRPEAHANGAAVLVLHGKDGPRRLYEELARRYAEKGFVAIVACWFAYPQQVFDDAYGCPGVGEFIGAEPVVITDVNAVVQATKQVRGVNDGRLGIVGQSYGARVALLRAATSRGLEPVVSSCGYLAERPTLGEPEVPRFPYPSDPDVAARIRAEVMVVQGEGDPITPVGQAKAFASAMAAADHPVHLVTYGAPAGHSIPWDVVSAFDEPDRLLRDRFLDDTAGWLRKRLDAGGRTP